MDRLPPISPAVAETDLQRFFAWAAGEKAITRMLQRGQVGYGEFLLRRQLNYDRLVREGPPAE